MKNHELGQFVGRLNGVRLAGADAGEITSLGITPHLQDYTPDSARLWVIAVCIEGFSGKVWKFTDERVQVIIGIKELTSHNSGLAVLDVSHN